MIKAASGIDSGTIIAIYLALFVFGIGYSVFLNWLAKEKYIEGFTSILVGLSIGITMATMAIINPMFTLIFLGALISSGLPMIFWATWKYMRERKIELQERDQELQKLRDEARRGN